MSLIKVRDSITGSITYQETNDSVLVHSVDGSGEYLGLVAQGLGTQVSCPPPEGPNWRWLSGRWQYVKPLQELINDCLREVDVQAGYARLRYITDVPGQEGTYIMKEAQAQSYIAGYSNDINFPVPIFVQAESEAMNNSPIEAATYIVETANQWQIKAAEIEKTRRMYKVMLSEAVEVSSVNDILSQALVVLNQL